MTKKLIIKGADGKYFTNRYENNFWSRNLEDAYWFDDEPEIQNKFYVDEKNTDADIKEELTYAVFPLEQITIWVK